MEGPEEEGQCGRCHKKSAVLISYSSLYATDVCKTCYLKLKVQLGPSSEKRDRYFLTDEYSWSIRRVV